MELLAKKHPEMRPLVADYKQMTLLERLRKRAEAREKDRRDTWAALEYARDEGREEVHAELDQVIMAKDQAIEAIRHEIEAKDQVIEAKDQAIGELRRKLREAGIDPQ